MKIPAQYSGRPSISRPRAPRNGQEAAGRVLIVDPSEESRDVLRTILQRRGIEIWETGEAGQGLKLAQMHRPDVIVLDAETESAEDPPLGERFGAEAHQCDGSLVILGNARVLGNLRQVSHLSAPAQVVAKPYHYGPLVHTIEKLLAQSTKGAQSVSGE